jgi:hypothetical protein
MKKKSLAAAAALAAVPAGIFLSSAVSPSVGTTTAAHAATAAKVLPAAYSSQKTCHVYVAVIVDGKTVYVIVIVAC